MVDVILAIALLLSSIAINFAHVRSTLATVAGRRFAAANWGALCYVLGMAGWTIAFTRGMWLLSFELAGFWIGTFVAVKKP